MVAERRSSAVADPIDYRLSVLLVSRSSPSRLDAYKPLLLIAPSRD